MNNQCGSNRVLAGALAMASALVLFPATILVAQSSSNVSTQTDFGINTTTFQTPRGQIQVNLPDDASAGDSLSGSVYAVPSGATDQQRASNQDELSGYVVQIQNKKTQVGKKVLKFGAPAAAGVTALVLLDGSGKQVSSVPVEIKPAQPASAPSANIKLPTISQAGRPLNIPGPFDGNSATTQVTIAGEKTQVLAESPRQTTVQAPSDAVGLQPIHVQKGTAVADGTVRNVAIKLSTTAPKAIVREGNKTTLEVTASGLEGLTTDLPLKLVNHSDAIVSLEGGDTQTITIHPSDVKAGGVFTVTRTLTGTEVGNFNLVAIVTEPTEGGGRYHGPVIAGNKNEGNKQCTDCTADSFNGPDAFNPGLSCAAPSACKNNNKSLQSDLANDKCRTYNTDNCTGNCPGTSQCNGIFDSANSNGLSVDANVDATNSKKCKAPLVTCDATLKVAAGGQLACKCSCNPK